MLLFRKLGVASRGKNEPTPSASIIPSDAASVSALLAELQAKTCVGLESSVGGGGGIVVQLCIVVVEEGGGGDTLCCG
jgi:hypothetical protein